MHHDWRRERFSAPIDFARLFGGESGVGGHLRGSKKCVVDNAHGERLSIGGRRQFGTAHCIIRAGSGEQRVDGATARAPGGARAAHAAFGTGLPFVVLVLRAASERYNVHPSTIQTDARADPRVRFGRRVSRSPRSTPVACCTARDTAMRKSWGYRCSRRSSGNLLGSRRKTRPNNHCTNGPNRNTIC